MADYGSSSLDSSGSSFYNTPRESPSQSYSELDSTSISALMPRTISPESVASESTLRSVSTAIPHPAGDIPTTDTMDGRRVNGVSLNSDLSTALHELNSYCFQLSGVQKQIQLLSEQVASLQDGFQRKLGDVVRLTHLMKADTKRATAAVAKDSSVQTSLTLSTISPKTISPTISKIPNRVLNSAGQKHEPARMPVKAFATNKQSPNTFTKVLRRLSTGLIVLFCEFCS